jgi:hypothetical protein
MILGPTEHRVARYLADRTTNGRVLIRTSDLIATLGLGRREGYRITARLRVLGLFGIENDRGGTKGGRLYWRTAIEHDGATLDATRHRVAWSRVVAWARWRSLRIAARLADLRQSHDTSRPVPGGAVAIQPAAAVPPTAAGSFAELMRRAGLGAWFDERRVT